MNSGIGVYENTFGREPLRAMTGYCISVIEVPMSCGMKLQLASAIQAYADLSIGRD